MKRTILSQTLLVLALLVGGCTEPHQKHPNGGLGGSDGGSPTDGPRDSGDVAQDSPSDEPGAEVDAGDADGERADAVVVAEAGSVSEGKPCSTDSNCGTGFCRDGVCCHESCEGICQACSAAFTNLDNGVCGPVVAGMDPRGVCTDESATNSCGQDGTCDGKSVCRKQGPDHVCAPASCSSDNKFSAAGTCDGSGTCAAGVVMSCGANPCAVTGCAKPCGVDGDCADGNFCANGTCKIKKIVGDTCDGASQCGSGNCSADKVCCASACTDACMACTEALTGQKNGTCAPVQAGKDPKDNCAADDPKSCGHDGTCDGKGGCAYYGANQTCSDPSCNGTKFLREGTCDGKGTCAAVTPVDCQATMCTPNGCKMACTADADCASGFYCASPGAMGSCLPKKSLGAACSSGQCADGACVDGVCCESACQDKCYACSSTLTGQPDGKCKPIQPAKTPQGECAASDASTCGQDGSCDGNGQCRKWSSGTS
ncbi:MAG TPA: Dickkopf N-terminal cysteine-rich domain-containing protein, partial [Polyangia bacterium]